MLAGCSDVDGHGETCVFQSQRLDIGLTDLGTPVAAMHLKGVFTGFLARNRETADAAAKAAEKEEIAAYKDATDGTRLKEREAIHKAAAEAKCLDARARLFDLLMAWMADLLRRPGVSA